MASRGAISVLLVDDDDEVLNTLSKVMENAGWRCLKAPTGEIALDSFNINEVDIVILDIKLPRMSGFDVLRRMKQSKPDVPVIMLTGLGYESHLVDEAVSLGASGYIGKAMPVRDVISKIKGALR